MSLIATMLKDADAAMLRGDSEAANRLYGHVADQEPENADAWNGLGAVHFERGELEESMAAFEKAKDLSAAVSAKGYPANKPALRALRGIGLNMYRMGREKEAKGVLEELLGLDPDDHMGARFLLKDIAKGKKLWSSRKK